MIIGTVRLSRGVLHLLRIGAVAYGTGIAALLVASLLAETTVMQALGVKRPASAVALVAGMRGMMLVGIASVPLAWLIASNLLAIVEAIGRGDPFRVANARRLRGIALALLGLQLLQIIGATIAAVVTSAADPIEISWPTDVTGWLAILLLLVLAAAFERGAEIREELDGTV